MDETLLSARIQILGGFRVTVETRTIPEETRRIRRAAALILNSLPCIPAHAADPQKVNAVLATFAGFFTFNSLQPAPPGLPTLRVFQAAQGEVARRWLAQRLGLD